MSLSDEDAGGVIIHSTDRALVDYGGINHLRFRRGEYPKHGQVMIRLAFGRGEHQNPGSPFGEGGTVRFLLAIRPFAGPLDVMEAHRFGESQMTRLRSRWLRANKPGFWTPRASQFVRLDSPAAMITNLKRAQAGAGYTVRVWAGSEQRALCRLSFPAHEVLSAWWTTTVERDIGRADFDGGEVQLELWPMEMTTLRFVQGR